MLRVDGASAQPRHSVRGGRRCTHRDAVRLRRRRARNRVAGRLGRNRDPRRRRDRLAARGLHRLPALPGPLLMRSGLLSTPRPEPGHLLPALAGSLVIIFALPLFLILGWRFSAWALAAV